MARTPTVEFLQEGEVSRSQVAKMLGITVPGVRHFESQNLLQKKRTVPGGGAVFDRQEVLRLVHARALGETDAALTRQRQDVAPELFQQVISLLRAGKLPVDIACEIAITPEQLFHCIQSYERLTDAMFLPGDVVRAVRAPGVKPPGNAYELVEDIVNLKKALAEARKKTETVHG